MQCAGLGAHRPKYMLTAQQLRSFTVTHLSFNSGMANASLCLQNLH